MYASKVADQNLTFQVSGLLWNSSLVMRDVETGSLWSHILGKCKAGDLLGTQLEVIPSTIATWKDWREQYPDTHVLDLDRTASEYVRKVYETPEAFVYGVKVSYHPRAYPFEFLMEKNVIQESIQDTPVLVVFDPESTMGFVYLRSLGNGPIDFDDTLTNDTISDRQTGSKWNIWTGRAVDGELKGQRLRHLYGIVSFRRAWDTFYPESSYAGEPRE